MTYRKEYRLVIESEYSENVHIAYENYILGGIDDAEGNVTVDVSIEEVGE